MLHIGQWGGRGVRTAYRLDSAAVMPPHRRPVRRGLPCLQLASRFIGFDAAQLGVLAAPGPLLQRPTLLPVVQLLKTIVLAALMLIGAAPVFFGLAPRVVGRLQPSLTIVGCRKRSL